MNNSSIEQSLQAELTKLKSAVAYIETATQQTAAATAAAAQLEAQVRELLERQVGMDAVLRRVEELERQVAQVGETSRLSPLPLALGALLVGGMGLLLGRRR